MNSKQWNSSNFSPISECKDGSSTIDKSWTAEDIAASNWSNFFKIVYSFFLIWWLWYLFFSAWWWFLELCSQCLHADSFSKHQLKDNGCCITETSWCTVYRITVWTLVAGEVAGRKIWNIASIFFFFTFRLFLLLSYLVLFFASAHTARYLLPSSTSL